MPGVLIVEAIAQAGGASADRSGRSDQKVMVFTGIERAISRPVVSAISCGWRWK